MALVLGLSSTIQSVAKAQTAGSSESTRNEARDRFDQGLRLFNEGNHTGALAEFKRAYELLPNPVVIFNIGLVYAATGRPVDAVDALEQVVGATTGLSDSDRLRAADVLREQSRRVAELVLDGVQRDYVVEIDGIQVGRIPLSRPLRVTVGSHVVTVIAAGYYPFKREVTVAGGERRNLQVDLTALNRKNSWIVVETQLPDAEIAVDGTVIGKTPATSTLTVTPGKHRVELRRPGYRVVAVDTEVVEEAKNVLRLEPEIDESQLSGNGAGTVRLSVSETDPSFVVDGRRIPGSPTQLRLPAGRHVVVTQRPGFVDQRETVDVAGDRTVDVHIDLTPTTETREAYVARNHRQRNWGWAALGAGAGIALGSGVFLSSNASKLKAAEQAYADILYASEVGSGRSCDVRIQIDRTWCDSELSTRYDELDRRRNYRTAGWVGVGVGGGLIVTGVVLFLTNDDATRYDRKTAPPASIRPVAAFDSKYQWFGVKGQF